MNPYAYTVPVLATAIATLALSLATPRHVQANGYRATVHVDASPASPAPLTPAEYQSPVVGHVGASASPSASVRPTWLTLPSPSAVPTVKAHVDGPHASRGVWTCGDWTSLEQGYGRVQTCAWSNRPATAAAPVAYMVIR
jgi:hypothetical protein